MSNSSEESGDNINLLEHALTHSPDFSSNGDGENTTEFDTNLPTTHRYLGKLDNVSGYTLFDDGEILTVLAIHTNTLVFPGFTLPLVLNTHVEQSIMQTFLSKTNIFALVCTDEAGTQLYKYGLLLEVFELFFKDDECLYLKAKGRQRCEILTDRSIRHLTRRLQEITVKILGEPAITSPLCNTQLQSLLPRQHYPNYDYNSLFSTARRYHLAQYSHPSWVYDRNEVCFYSKLVLEQLYKFYVKAFPKPCFSENIPTEPIALSYWFVQNFQLSHDERLWLLKLNSTIERLKLEYRFLQFDRILCCRLCKADVANQKDVFAMSKDGVQSNYCNPGGHVYETVTVSKAQNYYLVGIASKEFSWFPGYWWTIMQCQLCRGHIGWKFTAKHLQPSIFYGLAKSGLEVKIIVPDDDLE